MKWHTFEEKVPNEYQHILVEVDDHTMLSGNITRDYDDWMYFVGDDPLDQTRRNIQIDPDSILRWTEYPEE